jgi:1,4-dihydroxy-2-naphthoate octaprenyltransferase
MVMGSAAVFFSVLVLAAALAPFGLGVLLAAASGFPVHGPALAAALLAVASLVVAGLASREAFPLQADRGPRLWGWRREGWRRLAYAGLILAGVLGGLLQGVWHTGVFTIPLGAMGILGGYFVYAPPLAWQRRGCGELWGGLCFGLLPVLTGFYVQSHHLISEILLYGVPLSLAAFNFLLVLGMPAPGQEATGPPGSLAARLGPVPAALVYTIVNILVIMGLVFSLLFPAASHWSQPWLWALVGLALVNQELVKRRAYYQEARLRLLGWLTLTLILGMNLVFGLGLWGRL